MKFVEPGSGEVVAIRPDITPQIVRLYASRPDALPSPARLCYDGPVLRAREARAGRPREVYQAGVELLGGGGAAADAEALVLLAKALQRVGLRRAVVEVGHARFAQAVMDAARLPERVRGAAWEALSRKDKATLAALAAKGRGSPEARAALPVLATLYGDGALERGRVLARAVPGAAAALEEVEAALRLARRRGIGEVAIDLGEARGLGYYTGITFAGYAPGAGSAVAAGRPVRRAAGPLRPARPGHRLRGGSRVRHPGARARERRGIGAGPRAAAAVAAGVPAPAGNRAGPARAAGIAPPARRRRPRSAACSRRAVEPGASHMPNVVVVGAQWGDEGKGKIVDLLTAVRRRGGPLPGRQQRRAHAGGGRREDRPPPHPGRHPPPGQVLRHRQRRGDRPRGAS